jgi:UDP-N-acetylglucosamine--dolichyl-phosphate N-acetylglucosaminephosphotransferase
MLWILLIFAASFLATLLLGPPCISKLREAGILGHDIHKEGKPEVPEMGGLIILFGFSLGMLIAIPFLSDSLTRLFAAFLTILLTGLIGICDDLFGIRQKTKAWLPVFAAVPLMVIQAATSTITIPFLGTIDLGIAYALFLIPLEVTVIANASNMLAGYNGLEAGTGAIACLFLAAAGFLAGNLTVVVLMVSMAAACLAFLRFNRFPARLFMGDVGSFTIGAAIASAIIIGNMETVGGIIIGVYLLNGLITSVDILRGKPIKKFSDVKDGVLIPPAKTYVQTLYFWLEHRGKLTEKKLVSLLWILGILFGLLGLAVLIPVII